MAAILRRSLDLPHDKVGSNGRSTGPLQQLSSDVGGGWGDMAGTMDIATSVRRFLAALKVTDTPVYAGTLVTPTGSRRVEIRLSSPVAADVLRVQQPLADEAESSNYSAAQVAVAQQIAAAYRPTDLTRKKGLIVAEYTKEEFEQAIDSIAGKSRDATWRASVGKGFAAEDYLVSAAVAAQSSDAKLDQVLAALAGQRDFLSDLVTGSVVVRFGHGGGIARVDMGTKRWRGYGSMDELWADEKAVVDAGGTVIAIGQVEDPAARGWVSE
ncbi:hypothetical protein [Nakamurella leprariae]|uniref:Uncharacterized protein n=1 Tax=Nakamurella leprariae TaxID=2803911 RepID=A0A939BZ35_9ACTN|nr:hypothetical protein [Nakamurella leprariae]MBM9467276.1 hypothetical protein [Nakamurella leprariae]